MQLAWLVGVVVECFCSVFVKFLWCCGVVRWRQWVVVFVFVFVFVLVFVFVFVFVFVVVVVVVVVGPAGSYLKLRDTC